MSDLRENLEQRLDDDRPTGPVAAAKGAASGGFFTVYRPHQGGWTRLGTAIASGLLIVCTAVFLAYDVGPAVGWNTMKHSPTPYVVIGWVLGSSFLAWYLQSRVSNVDFLIDTDSEMKKVNWTSSKELIGSTRIVILFMLILSAMLFLIDMMFQYFFHWINVLQLSPFQHAGGK